LICESVILFIVIIFVWPLEIKLSRLTRGSSDPISLA
jgi:hypothetical protein